MIATPRPIPFTALAAAILAVALCAVASPAQGQAPCSLTAYTTWCADLTTLFPAAFIPAGAHFGKALAFGDFNGDGFDDLAIGAPDTSTNRGTVYVLPSDGQLPCAACILSLTQNNVGGSDGGAQEGEQFGFALASGDFNADGFDDLAIGSPGEVVAETNPSDCIAASCVGAGAVHVVYGSATGLQPAAAQFFHAGTVTSTTADGPADDERFGQALAVGRFVFREDGFDDLVIGAPGHRNVSDQQVGILYFLLGAAGGIGTGDGGFRHGPDGIEPPCDATGAHLGEVLAAGRFELDTIDDDLVVGTPECSLGGKAEAGMVHTYGPPQILSQPSLHFQQTDYASAGQAALDRFGQAVAVGDFDGNGFDDLAASAPFKAHGAGNPSSSGRVYVAYSGVSGQGPDPSTSPDIIGEDEWAGDTPGAGEHFGSGMAAGDVDGDGRDDLLMGAPNEGTQDVGRVYLKRGGPSGLTTANNALFTQTFLGGVNQPSDHLGNVIALGDVDGDGVLEIALGVPDKDVPTDAGTGMVYVTRAFGPRFFKDGFESGDKAAWSASTP